MHKPDFDTFRQALNVLADTFGRKPLDDLVLQVYWRALRDLPLEAFQRGCAYHARYGRHFPRPVELRPKDDKPTGAPESMDAQGEGAVQAEGWLQRAYAAGDPLAQAAIREAAWARKLALTDEREPHYRQVLAGYREAADAHRQLLTGRK